MAKRVASGRLRDLIRAATDIFIAKGYRRTQMADVTNAMGLSPGAVYRYVESKEALFDLVVRAAASVDLRLDKIALPIPTPQRGATLDFLQKTLKCEAGMPSLEAALARTTVNDPAAEFEAIVRELYSRTARFRVGIRLLDRSALDWPELGSVWSTKVRTALIQQLARYLELRMSQGFLRPVPDSNAWARLIIEMVAFFAMHRHYDPDPTPMDEKVAQETVLDALVHSLVLSKVARDRKGALESDREGKP